MFKNPDPGATLFLALEMCMHYSINVLVTVYSVLGERYNCNFKEVLVASRHFSIVVPGSSVSLYLSLYKYTLLHS